MASAGNGRLAGLKMSVRMEVTRACNMHLSQVEIQDIFETRAGEGHTTGPAGAASEGAAVTVVDMIVSPHAISDDDSQSTCPEGVGWNAEIDLSKTAKALMDQVERNSSALGDRHVTHTHTHIHTRRE